MELNNVDRFYRPQPVAIWRGPMAAKALTRFVWRYRLGRDRYMIVDFPPEQAMFSTAVQKLKLTVPDSHYATGDLA